jgi:hypothetical protein
LAHAAHDRLKQPARECVPVHLRVVCVKKVRPRRVALRLGV